MEYKDSTIEAMAFNSNGWCKMKICKKCGSGMIGGKCPVPHESEKALKAVFLLKEQISTDEAANVAYSMKEHGGNFVKILGDLLLAADAKNRLRLKQAFPEHWVKYKDWPTPKVQLESVDN